MPWVRSKSTIAAENAWLAFIDETHCLSSSFSAFCLTIPEDCQVFFFVIGCTIGIILFLNKMISSFYLSRFTADRLGGGKKWIDFVF